MYQTMESITIELNDYGTIQWPEHSATFLFCTNTPEVMALAIGKGCMARFQSGAGKTSLYALRVS
jgi:hypothetical protein